MARRDWATDADTSMLGGVATVGALAAFSLIAGIQGVIVGVGLLAAWVALPGIAVFTLGQIAIAALLPARPALLDIAVLQAPLVAFLFLNNSSNRFRAVGITAFTIVGFGGLAIIGIRSVDALWMVSALLVGATTLVTYAMHRYTVVHFHYSTNEF